MKLLLDTCIVSEWARPSGRDIVEAALSPFSDEQLYLSVVTLGEIETGICKLDFGARRAGLETWAAHLQKRFAGRLISVDPRIALYWGRISGELLRKGRPMSVTDSMLAATAIAHGFMLVTRNSRDFASLDLSILNPWVRE